MAITEQKVLNEVLIRWDDAGVIKGAHCSHLELIVKDGVNIHAKQGTAEPLPLGSTGLSEVLSQVQHDALAQLDIEQTSVSDLTAQLETEQATSANLQSELSIEQDSVASLQTELSGLQEDLATVKAELALLKEQLTAESE